MNPSPEIMKGLISDAWIDICVGLVFITVITIVCVYILVKSRKSPGRKMLRLIVGGVLLMFYTIVASDLLQLTRNPEAYALKLLYKRH